jgi:hypothetical protein
MDAAVKAARTHALDCTLPGVQEALLRSPTVPPALDASAPGLARAARFVSVLLGSATAFAWLVLPQVL